MKIRAPVAGACADDSIVIDLIYRADGYAGNGAVDGALLDGIAHDAGNGPTDLLNRTGARSLTERKIER